MPLVRMGADEMLCLEIASMKHCASAQNRPMFPLDRAIGANSVQRMTS